MAITINRKWDDVELVRGISRSEDSLEVRYLLRGDDDEDEEDIELFAANPTNIPHTLLGLYIRNFRVRRHEDTEEYWEVTVSYASGSAPQTLPKLDVDEFRWQIVGGGGTTIKQTFSNGLVSETLGTGQAAPALSGTAAERAIGLVYQDGDYEVDGVDVSVGATQISVQTVWDYATAMTGGRILLAAEYANIHAVNSVAWGPFPAGTLRIENFTCKNRPGDEPEYDVDFVFTFSKNLTNIVVGNGITVPSKKGHQTLDVLYAKKNVGGLPIPVPIRAAVHDVPAEINFGTVLGLA